MKTLILASFILALTSITAQAQSIAPVVSTICSSYHQASNQTACIERLKGKKLDKDVAKICFKYNQADNREACATSLAGANIADGVVDICNRYQEARNVQICALSFKNVNYLDKYVDKVCQSYQEARNVHACALDLANLEFEPVYAEQCLSKYNQANNRQTCVKRLGTVGLRVQAASIRTCDEYTAFAATLRAEFNVDDEIQAELIRDLITKLNAKFAICLIPVQSGPQSLTTPAAEALN